ncbi:MAG: endolytic transglycosylase MltG [Micromonosporaceae bacterium]|nr:endolytic transglycosylase MltG [Micromonosporaceae bacterium]
MRTDEDWQLDWDDEPAPRRHRRGQRATEQRRPRKSKKGRTIVALILSLTIIGGLGGAAWYGLDRIQEFFVTPDYTTAGTGSVEVEIVTGQTAADIGQTLYDQGVVKSVKAFTEAAKKDQRSLTIAPGFYQLRLKMRGEDALALLLDPNSRVVNKVTIPEGLMTLEIYALLSEKTSIPVADFKAAAKDPAALGIPDYWFTRDDKKESGKSVEGFLFPATYELPRNGTAKSILSMMVKKFLAVAEKLDFVDQAQNERNITPYEVLIAASIAQIETPLAADMAKATRVLYNRLYGPNFPTRRLEIDSAVNYSLKLQGKDAKASQELKYSEMHNKNNPYSYENTGWPPTPISNPGETALKAAINPDSDTAILYWVTIDKAGNTAFSKTFAEHEKNCAKARQNGAL